MDYITTSEAAVRWNVSERSVRNYCARGRVGGAVLIGGNWMIPAASKKPTRKARALGLTELLAYEKKAVTDGIYRRVLIDMTYFSSRLAGNRLSYDQTRFLFESNTLSMADGVSVDDVMEMANHFRCASLVIERAKAPLSESFLKALHRTLKSGTGVALGEYRKEPIAADGEAVLPEAISGEMRALLADYNEKEEKTIEDLLDLHCRILSIQPFSSGNGRIARLILFKECLKNGILPFIVDDALKSLYLRGVAEWGVRREYLLDAASAGEERFKKHLDYFGIPY